MFKCRIMYLVLCLGLVLPACSKEETLIKEEFSSPEKTYLLWLETSEKGDIANNIRCLTESSRYMMDAQLKQMDEFIKRLNVNLRIFRTYVIAETKIENDKAIIVLKEPKGGTIIVPLIKEAEGWKIDLAALFGGGQ